MLVSGDPYRGCVPIADDILIAARNHAVATPSESPPVAATSIGLSIDDLVAKAVRVWCPKFDRVTCSYAVLSSTYQITARCNRCQAAACTDMRLIHTDVPTAMRVDGVDVAAALADTISRLGCYCVTPT